MKNNGSTTYQLIPGLSSVGKTIISQLLILCLMALSVMADETGVGKVKDGAYGVVLRKQSSGNRVMVQPLEGLFVPEVDIRFIDKKGDVVCGGKVQKVYSNLIYAIAEGCEKFDEIYAGAGVTYNRDGKTMLEIYDSKDKVDTVVRENEWNKSSGIPMEIAEDQFENIVKKSKVPVFLEIYATWCPHCDEFKPILGEIAKDLEGKVRVAVTDEEKCPELKRELKVKSYPALFVFVDGKITDEWRGAYPRKNDSIIRINNGLNKVIKK